jgi:8-oxo-dGTP diphosphatase
VNEDEYLATYDPRAYPPVAVTVDVVALTIRDGELNVLLIKRAEPPYAGRWALPGGFVRPDEDLPDAAGRVLAGETGLGADPARAHLEQLASYGAPRRDPRMRVVSVAYLAFAPSLPEPNPSGSAGVSRAGPHGGSGGVLGAGSAAGAGAGDVAWVPVRVLGLPDAASVPDRPLAQRPGTSRRLAFDHARVLADGLERARSKLEYTPLATRFAGNEFAIAELRAVYETVWGARLRASNFHRKVLSVPGFVESTGATTERGGARGGPRARLYRAGDARLLHPALLRPSREEEVR